jgi:CysZ protein
MLAAAIQAFRELFTPPFRAMLFKCVGLTVGLLVLLIVLIEGLFNYTVAWPDWIEMPLAGSAGLGSS